MRKLLLEVAKFINSIKAWVRSIPGYEAFERICKTCVSPIVAFANKTLKVFPRLRKLEWLLEIERLTKLSPVLLAFLLAFTIFRGLMPTQFGHIGTDTIIFGFLGAMSMFNPFLGLSLAIAFAMGDWTQKLVLTDIYGTKGRDMNYWGAMVGYLVAYSAPLLAGIAPGMVSRVARLAVRKSLTSIFAKSASATADGMGADGPWTVYEKIVDGKRNYCVAQEMPGAEWMPRQSNMDWDDAWSLIEELKVPIPEAELPRDFFVFERRIGGRIERTVASTAPNAEWMPITAPVNWTEAWTQFASMATPGMPGAPVIKPPSLGGFIPNGANFPVPELVASVLAGGLTVHGIMHLAPKLVEPAFYWRPEPDVSCHELEAEKFLSGHGPASAAQTIVGGTSGLILDSGSRLDGPTADAPLDPQTPTSSAQPPQQHTTDKAQTSDPTEGESTKGSSPPSAGSAEQETGDRSRTVPAGPRPEAGIRSDVVDGSKATHILVDAGMLEPVPGPGGTIAYRPTDLAGKMKGKPFTIRYGEAWNTDNELTATQDSPYANVSGTGWELNPDGTIKGDPVIVVEHAKAAGPNGGWVNWITPNVSATEITRIFGSNLPADRLPNPAHVDMQEPDHFIRTIQTNLPGETPEEIYKINAYVDPTTRRLIVGVNSGNPGTIPHEMIHGSSNPGFRGNVPFLMNEGMTEHFTQQITAPANINRNHVQYNSNGSTRVMSTIAGIVGEDVVRQAYFGTGAAPVDAMRNALDAAGGPGTWDAVRNLMGVHVNPANPIRNLPPDPDAALAALRRRIRGI